MTPKKKKKQGKPTGLDKLARSNGYTSYDDYLGSQHWKNVRQMHRESGLGQRCIACLYPTFELHHVTYVRMTFEELWDVIPLCNRCHHDVHRQASKFKISSKRPDLVLQRIWGWDDAERRSRFSFYLDKWEEQSVFEEEDRKRRIKETEELCERRAKRRERDAKVRATMTNRDIAKGTPVAFYVLSKSFSQLQEMAKRGVGVKEIAEHFDVEEKEVTAFMGKYKSYFRS